MSFKTKFAVRLKRDLKLFTGVTAGHVLTKNLRLCKLKERKDNLILKAFDLM